MSVRSQQAQAAARRTARCPRCGVMMRKSNIYRHAGGSRCQKRQEQSA